MENDQFGQVKHKIIFTPEAIQHLSHISRWYNNQNSGLGKKFKQVLKSTLDKLRDNPFINTIRYDEVRFALTHKFPYAAHYTISVTNSILTVHAVFAFKESPQKWSENLYIQ